MTPDEIAVVRGELEGFAAEVFEPFARNDQRRWGQVYLRGLLMDGQRKSVEPMAARLGEDGNRQALAHFVTTSPWDPAHVRARLAWRMEKAIRPTALVFDDTGFLKDGNASACVSRQYTGTAGKVTNCRVGVSLHMASGHASAAVDWRLFLPETWAPGSVRADPDKVARRTACGIPDDIGHVEKWQLALDMLDETRSWGIEVPLAIADAGYGDAAAFRLGLQARGLNYVVGISTTMSAQPGEAVPVTEVYSGTGRPPAAKYPDKPQSVKQLVLAAGHRAAKPVQWREGSRPGTGRSGFKRMYSRFVALRIRPAGREVRQAAEGPELPECWLLAEWPAGQGEPVQFWLSDLPADTPLTTLVRLAKLRWRIEHDYREMKQALGLAHFEGRTWGGWHHHVTLVSVAHAFCTLQRLTKAPKAMAPA
ncbi:IS701 family transposase [Streptomyces sp. NPDC059698]|uniref:IS701 family transposase n=1 Tax=Streptomyces TaxID=1883 RepID=UPI00093CC238|nr:IS701 family transposase [Streptomyces sp. CB02366]OKJ29564.1 transposase [Streptomyces sp. CB02366]